jgi:hypothetical protein
MRKFRVAESAVAPARPTPTPSRMRCVARMEQREVDRSWMFSYKMELRYPELLNVSS